MNNADRLAATMHPPGSDASFAATMHAELARIEPLTAPAAEWLRRIVSDEANWEGDALILELRYFGGVAEAAVAAGFTFESEAPPN